jgi:hypothetical protein
VDAGTQHRVLTPRANSAMGYLGGVHTPFIAGSR